MIFKQLFDDNSFTFTYIIASKKGREALIIDPVLENIQSYNKILEDLELKLVKVIDTHIHADHISAMAELKKNTRCQSIMGEHSKSEVVNLKVKENEKIKIDDLELKALYTPGHTDDSYSFLLNNTIFTGDTLLINGTGRTDFQNGSAEKAYDSIFNKLFKLPEETTIYPAHDYNGKKSSTIGAEKRNNPRLQVKSAEAYAELMNNLNLPYPKMMDTIIPANLKGKTLDK